MTDTIGTYQGHAIPSHIMHNGARYEFVGVAVEDTDGAVPLAQLGDNEVVAAPGLIYRLAPFSDTENGCDNNRENGAS